LDNARLYVDAQAVETNRTISGAALADLARQYLLAEAVVRRLANVIDRRALEAIASGVALDLRDAGVAEASARALETAMGNHTLSVFAQYDNVTDKHRLRIERRHHGNIKASHIDSEFTLGADYALLANSSMTFAGLVGAGAKIARGEGEKTKEAPVADFRGAMQWLLAQAENGIGKQRYKGLGEMNPEQLWETTMDPAVRRLLRVQIEDAIGADQIFTTLMGDEVEPRRQFIEFNALAAGNIDA
jgi:DNA gyrase subunit B